MLELQVIASSTLPPGEQGQHYELIKQAIPSCLVSSSPERRQALKQTPANIPSWYDATSQSQKDQLKTLLESRCHSLNELEKSLSKVQALEAFAQPLLEAALKAAGYALDVNQTWLRLYVPVEDAFGKKTGGSRVKTFSLLKAALGNFEAREAEDGFYDSVSGFITEPDTREHFERHTTTLKIHEFAQLCRDLDLGSQYQAHLRAQLIPDDVRSRAEFRDRFIRHQKDAFKAAAYLALLKGDIGATDYTLLMRVTAGEKHIVIGNQPVGYCCLSLMNLHLHDCLIIAPCAKQRYSSWVIVYIPDHFEHPIKRYETFNEFRNELTDHLTASVSQGADRSKGVQTTQYQQLFAQFVAYKDRAYYYRRLTELVVDAPPQPFGSQALRSEWGRLLTAPFFSSGSSLGEPQPTVRVPIKAPEFNIQAIEIAGLWRAADLWVYRHASLRTRLFNDAQHQAVSTEAADKASSSRRAAHYLSIGMFGLNLVGMAVPPLGLVMAGVMAGQLLYEVFEGAVELSEGDREAGWAHVTDVVENLATLAAQAVALRFTVSPFIERLKAVTLPGGKIRLWKPDLAPYKVPVELDTGAKPDALGLYSHDGQLILHHEGDHYRVGQDPVTGQYRIQHPSRPGAYEPQLEHNHAGAWSHEIEQPLTWDKPTLMRRLGLEQRGLDSATLEQARMASGVEEDVLRQTFVEHDPVPLLLDDTIQHFKAHQALTTFVEQLRSSDSAVYAQADLTLLLQIMRRRGMLPDAPLRVMDSHNRILWEETFATAPKRVVVVRDNQLASGEWLNEVLFSLQGVDPTLRDIPGSAEESLAVRAGKLREHIANVVDTFKGSLVEERYQALNATNDPDVRLLMATYPRLPASMATELLRRLSVEQLHTFRDTGFLPQERIEQARWLEQETRVSRAYEGLHLDTLASIDSQRLALRTLETLPGWQRGTRVELRHYSAQGTLLDAIGSPDSTTTKALVLKDNGLFEAPMPRDFFGATWDLLSTAERQSLGFTDAQQLKTAIQQSPLPREPLRTVLLEHPVRKPTIDSTLRLLGGGGGSSRQAASDVDSDVDLVHEQVTDLFPLMDEEAVNAFVRTLGDDVEGGLKHWKAEFKTFTRELDAWVYASGPPRADGWDADFPGASDIAREIKSHWRLMSEGPLKLMMRGDLELPLLSVDFSHVEGLEIYGSGWTGKTDAFLTSFTHVKHLALIGCRLTELPSAIGEMRYLTSLNLTGNNLELTPPTSRMLSNLSALVTLDLRSNPLGAAPDVSGMPNLVELNLSNTQIEQWPSGLTALTGLRRVDLSENRLQEVPPQHLTPPPEQLEAIVRTNNVVMLEHNKFPADYWQQFDRYWETLTRTRPELLQGALDGAFDSGNPRLRVMQELYPDNSVQTSRKMIWALGERADAELAQREQEFKAFKRQLKAWNLSNERQSNERVGRNERLLEFNDRDRARQRIMSCWRAGNPLVLSNDATLIDVELDLSGLRLSSLPDLGANFIRPTSLKLNRLNLRTSPEGFLAHCQGVRWLDMSDNHLFELPPAVGNMNELARLSLQNNRIRLTAESAALLSSRATLSDLMLNDNPLGLTPDFSQMTDLRTLQMKNTGIDTWPAGLVERTNLLWVDLSQNSITTIPDSVIAPSDEQLAQTERVTRVTDIGENPLTEQTRQQVREHSRRLEEAGLMSEVLPNMLRLTADIAPNRVAPTAGAQNPFLRWAQGMSTQEASSKRPLWVALERAPRAAPFFDILERLEPAGAGHADLQRRVWEVIESITQDTAESETLRKELLDLAGEPGCCDLAAFSFSNLEVRTMAYKARLQATDQTQGVQLARLSRGLFRLHEVDKIASADIQRSEAIVNDPRVSIADKLPHTQRLAEEVEIRLAYRYGLKDRLQLPGQPQQVRYINLGGVTALMLDTAYDTIKALDNSAQELQALLSRGFWQDYLTGKYAVQFDALRHPLHDQLADLRSRFESNAITEALYKHRSGELQLQLQIKDAALIETLTRQELLDHPLDMAEGVVSRAT
ncbi:hypothetical protein HX797_09335 [Pseudomonas edaphica]|uniref:RING-type E3 ubiquitin transferase n=1 Tax=Pseudomonas edaphica TaxID=2006980 RepID=A0A7Y7RQD1_9PSED|nr:DUF6543 domain-containing protein [Pseudomonas edaphica]NVZ56469.1 hypothetical protein [Pseudomonas edaphica]